jgi:hypothetical protein
MYAQQLQHIVDNDARTQIQFLGVFPADMLPERMPTSSLAIVNCCNRNLPGLHWIALYQGQIVLEVFDSFGLPPQVYNLQLPQADAVSYNAKQVQSNSSELCGQYCLYYCYFKARGYNINDIISVFSDDYYNNDKYVYDVVLRLYNI